MTGDPRGMESHFSRASIGEQELFMRRMGKNNLGQGNRLGKYVSGQI